MDYKERIRSAVADRNAFVGLTLSGPAKKDASPWVRVRVRPVLVQGERMLQFSYFDGTKDVAKNYAPADATAPLEQALALPFSHAELQTTAGDLHVRITRKGKALVSEGKPSSAEVPRLEHDHAKRRALAENDPLWRALEMAGKDGRILPRARGKFTQVNEFLRILGEALDEAEITRGPLNVLDAGCGSAWLTFAAYHYINTARGLDARVVGVDTNADLIGKCIARRNALGWTALDFRIGSIAEFEPGTPPDVVLSLHACDTATDEALARGVLWKSRVILAAPCCQHELHGQLGTLPYLPSQTGPAEGTPSGDKAVSLIAFAPVLRHGLLRERLADILTDAFRALALRVMGYRVAVCEFVESEHTSKNLMLRAVRAREPGDPDAAAEFIALKRFWSVEPAVERLLGKPFRRLLR